MNCLKLSVFIVLTNILLASNIVNQLCYISNKQAIYDVTSLENNQDYIMNVSDDLYISYNICRFSYNQCHGKYAFAVLFSRSTESCVKLTNNTKYYGITTAPIDQRSPELGVSFNFTGGDYISTTTSDPNAITTPNNNNITTNNDSSSNLSVNTTTDTTTNTNNTTTNTDTTDATTNTDTTDTTTNTDTNNTATNTDTTNTTGSTNTNNIGNQKRYSFILNIFCDKDSEDYKQINQTFDQNSSTYIINASSMHACPVLSLSQISDFIYNNWIPFTIVGVLFGLAEAFFGYKLFVPTLFFAGFSGAFIASFIVLFITIVNGDSSNAVKWIIIIFSALMGIAVGYVTAKTAKIGLFLLGAWLGCIIALVLYNAVLYQIEVDPPQLLLWISMGILGALCGILGVIFYQFIAIISTSLCGSYIFIRAISLPIGGFPNEFALADQIQDTNYDFTVTWQFYVYMNAIIVLCLLSIWIQYKIKKLSDSKKQQEDLYFKQNDNVQDLLQ